MTACSALATALGEPLAGTAPVAGAWIVIENPGPWGRDAVEDSRLPDDVRQHLRGAKGRGISVLLARRPDRPERTASAGVHVWVARSAAGGMRLRHGLLADPGPLARWDLDAIARGELPALDGASTTPLLLVCTHSKRDQCCAIHGRSLVGEIMAVASAEQRERVWECSHIGGHRFAPVTLSLPSGAIHGRLAPGDGVDLLDRTDAGRVRVDLLRGRSCFPGPLQAAEVAVRATEGIDAVADLDVLVRVSGRTLPAPVAWTPEADQATAEVRHRDGRAWLVEVHRRDLPQPRPESCGKEALTAHTWTCSPPVPLPPGPNPRCVVPCGGSHGVQNPHKGRRIGVHRTGRRRPASTGRRLPGGRHPDRWHGARMEPSRSEPAPFVVTASGAGPLTREACRTTQFRQPSRGLRIPVTCPDSLLTRCRAVDLVSRDDAVLWGPTAAQLLGLPLPFRLEDLEVHVMVPEGMPRPRRRGVRTRQADIIETEIVSAHGLRVTSGARTFTDLAAFLSLPDLVAVGDEAMRRCHVTSEQFTRALMRRLRYPGKVKARDALPLLDAGSESPQESRLRVHIILDGLPRPEVNGIITDDAGGFLARCDLVYRQWRIVIEYDGAVHDAPARRRADATRRTLLREHGWYVVEIVDEDLRHPQRAADKVRRALRARGAL